MSKIIGSWCPHHARGAQRPHVCTPRHDRPSLLDKVVRWCGVIDFRRPPVLVCPGSLHVILYLSTVDIIFIFVRFLCLIIFFFQLYATHVPVECFMSCGSTFFCSSSSFGRSRWSPFRGFTFLLPLCPSQYTDC
jgi:hypothetical protein